MTVEAVDVQVYRVHLYIMHYIWVAVLFEYLTVTMMDVTNIILVALLAVDRRVM